MTGAVYGQYGGPAALAAWEIGRDWQLTHEPDPPFQQIVLVVGSGERLYVIDARYGSNIVRRVAVFIRDP
ncbi:MAG: hypothetical protein ABR509_07090 [Candidatus Limnocylindria bacterium]